MKIGVLLSGCGVYDGAEIQEAVLSMLAIEEQGDEVVCISVNKDQHHVVNHLTGEEMPEKRNMMVEAARIARGNVLDCTSVFPAEIDALVIPGGFGSAKNFTKWAFNGPDGDILPEVKLLLVNMYNAGKPIVALCVSPVVLAKALEGVDNTIELTLGTTKESSPYDINSFHDGVGQLGMTAVEKTITEIAIDTKNRIISAPCYMLDASIVEIRNNIKSAVSAIHQLV